MNGGVTVLTGGIGGAKLVDGLYRCLPAGALTAIVNTGDDFIHLGLSVSPDIDSLLYQLSGQSNLQLGWGREDETWSFMAALQRLAGPDWFKLGDGDLALHVLRSHALRSGETLTGVTTRFTTAWGLSLAVFPMSDTPVATWLDTDEGQLSFQHYFVARQCKPIVRSISYLGASQAHPPAGALQALEQARLIVIAPSNPWLSIDPVLAIPAITDALQNRRVPVIAVSPLVAGQAVKGPTAKLMAELGIETSNASIAAHYAGLIDGLIVHQGDDAPDGLPVMFADTMMRNQNDRIRVAQAALNFADRLVK